MSLLQSHLRKVISCSDMLGNSLINRKQTKGMTCMKQDFAFSLSGKGNTFGKLCTIFYPIHVLILEYPSSTRIKSLAALKGVTELPCIVQFV